MLGQLVEHYIQTHHEGRLVEWRTAVREGDDRMALHFGKTATAAAMVLLLCELAMAGDIVGDLRDDAPEDVRRYILQCQGYEPTVLSGLRAMLAEAPRAQTRAIRSRILLLQRRNAVPAAPMGDYAAVGSAGLIEPPVEIAQVIDKDRMLVRPMVLGRGYIDTPMIHARDYIVQRCKPMEYQSGDALLLLNGVSTDGLSDGMKVELGIVLKVVGTYRYMAAIGGQRTVPELRPMDMQSYMQAPTTQPLHR